jgi:outer membrane lipoprotein carrier protein
MSIIRVFITYLLIAFLGTNWALGADLTWIVQKIQEKYDQTDDLSANFRQTVYIASLGQEQKGQGKVYLKKPGRMRWEYEEPEEQLIVSDGELLWIYDPSLNQVVEHNWEQAYPSKVPTLFLAGLGKLEKDFLISFLSSQTDNEQSNIYWIKLIPKDKQLNLTELVLGVDAKTFLIQESRAQDNLGNITKFQFYDIKINSGLSDTVFHFTPPEGVEKIDTSDMLPKP